MELRVVVADAVHATTLAQGPAVKLRSERQPRESVPMASWL